MGEVAQGVRHPSRAPGDEIIGMERLRPGTQVLAITEKGFGKRTSVSEYRIQNRGGKGLITLKVTDRNGELVGIRIVEDRDEILLMSSEDTMIRISVNEIPSQGRNTQGVKLMSLKKDERVVAVAKLPPASLDDVEKIE